MRKFILVVLLNAIIFLIITDNVYGVEDRIRQRIGQTSPPKIPLIPKKFLQIFPRSQFNDRDILGQKRLEKRKRFGSLALQMPDTVKILVLKVEFLEDSDPASYGNGKFELKPYQDSLDTQGKKNIFYDPPHTTRYFYRMMQSLRNFYQANSGGNLNSDSTSYDNGKLEIVYDIYPKDADSLESKAAYTMPHTMCYYSDYGSWYYTRSTRKLSEGMTQLFVDAVKAAENDVARFQNYDGLVIFHAGINLQISAGFAIQQGMAPCDLLAGTLFGFKPPLVAHGGTDTVWGGTIIGETNRYQDALVGLYGTLFHEVGHILGLPDLYDVSYNSAGLGNWELMAGGGYNGEPPGFVPASLSAWAKQFLGIIKVDTIIKSEPRRLRAVELLPQSVFRIPINSKEYFLVENKQTDLLKNNVVGLTVRNGVVISVDQYDSYLPGDGILIWHVDEEMVNRRWKDNSLQAGIPPAIALEEADGIMDLQHWTDSPYWNGDKRDAFYGGGNSSFTSFTTPNSNSNSGGVSHISVSNISASDTSMTMDVSLGWLQPGWPQLTGGAIDWNSPIVYDVDGKGDLEILVTSTDGRAYGWHFDGSKLIPNGFYFYWYERKGRDSIRVTAPAAIFSETGKDIFSSISVGDIDGDGNLEMVFGSDDKKLYAYKPRPGRPDTTYAERVRGFPITIGEPIESTPLLVDLNKDGREDIVFGAFDRKIHAYGLASGDSIFRELQGFPVDLGLEIASTPASADLDLPPDGIPEIIVLGGDGRIFVINANGTIRAGWPQIIPKLGFAFSSPAIGDINRDGILDVVVASFDKSVYAFSSDGKLLQGWPANMDANAIGSTALGDIDRDGYLEVLVTAGKKLYAFNYNGTIVTNFPIFISDSITVQSSPVLGDIDGDGKLDIVVGSPDQKVYAFDSKGREVPGFPLTTGDAVLSTPTIFNNGGDVGIAVGCDDGYVYIWHIPSAFNPSTMVWPMIHQNKERTGFYPSSLLPPLPSFSGELLPRAKVYAYPNPATQTTTIRYFLAEAASVKIEIFNIAGELIKTFSKSGLPQTENEVNWNLDGIASGVYFCRVEAKAGSRTQVQVKKIAVVK